MCRLYRRNRGRKRSNLKKSLKNSEKKSDKKTAIVKEETIQKTIRPKKTTIR